jgi:hypothetical protein
LKLAINEDIKFKNKIRKATKDYQMKGIISSQQYELELRDAYK